MLGNLLFGRIRRMLVILRESVYVDRVSQVLTRICSIACQNRGKGGQFERTLESVRSDWSMIRRQEIRRSGLKVNKYIVSTPVHVCGIV